MATKTKKMRAVKKTGKGSLRDLKPEQSVRGGILIGLLLPAVQKVREAA